MIATLRCAVHRSIFGSSDSAWPEGLLVGIGHLPSEKFAYRVSSSRGGHFTVVLRGNYEPPLGIAGKTFDAAVGGRIARATAREFLERIREFIEAAYRATERAKKARERGFDG